MPWRNHVVTVPRQGQGCSKEEICGVLGERGSRRVVGWRQVEIGQGENVGLRRRDSRIA